MPAPWQDPGARRPRPRAHARHPPRAGAPPGRHVALPAAAPSGRGTRARLARDRRARLLDDAGHGRPAPVHQRPDALPGRGAARPGGQPHGRLRARLRAPDRLGGAARRAPRRGRRIGRHRRAQRAARGHRQGFAPGLGVRRQRRRRGRSERAAPDRREVVRRHLHRGPGPVVARRPDALGLPVRDAARVPGRRGRDGRAGRGRRRPARLDARGPGRRPARRPRAGLARRGPAGGLDEVLHGAAGQLRAAPLGDGQGRPRAHPPSRALRPPRAWARTRPAGASCSRISSRPARARRAWRPACRACSPGLRRCPGCTGWRCPLLRRGRLGRRPRPGAGRLPQRAGARHGPARQRPARPHPGCQPPRLRPAHRARHHPRRPCAATCWP